MNIINFNNRFLDEAPVLNSSKNKESGRESSVRSAAELQRQLGMKRYEPVFRWYHKLMAVMGKRDDRYRLEDEFTLPSVT